MKEKNFILKECPLFAEIADSDLEALLHCLSAEKEKFKKNSYIFSMEEKVTKIGIILSGRVYIIKEDFWGNRAIFSQLAKGELFGEAFCCAEAEEFPIAVLAIEETQVLMIDYYKIITTCSNSCLFHAKLIKNMLKILAYKNIMLTQKMEHLVKRTTREKLLSYLSEQAMRKKSNIFDIPFNRQELADYLSVDRSAMSNELSKMQKDGLLNFKRNHFELKNLF